MRILIKCTVYSDLLPDGGKPMRDATEASLDSAFSVVMMSTNCFAAYAAFAILSIFGIHSYFNGSQIQAPPHARMGGCLNF